MYLSQAMLPVCRMLVHTTAYPDFEVAAERRHFDGGYDKLWFFVNNLTCER